MDITVVEEVAAGSLPVPIPVTMFRSRCPALRILAVWRLVQLAVGEQAVCRAVVVAMAVDIAFEEIGNSDVCHFSFCFFA